MPQEPKKKHSKGRKRTRRAALLLKQSALIKCQNCSEWTLPHIMCKACGFYGKRKIKAKLAVKVTKP